MNREELIKRISYFIKYHAKLAKAYDPAYDDPSERFNGPDSAMMEMAQKALEAGQPVPKIMSSFNSGCYTGLRFAELEHDAIVHEINSFKY